jgi:hypothetical protein
MADFEAQLKKEFDILMKGGKTIVWGFIDECESYLKEIQSPNIIDIRITEIVINVKSEKRFSFGQFKEVYPFVLSHRKLAEVKNPDDEFIMLD